MVRDYYHLTKPGIVYGNTFTTVAAFLFAARYQFAAADFFVPTILGIASVIAAACVFNNYLDRDIDAKMSRTKERALVSGTIPVRNALLFGAALLLVGLVLLGVWVNVLTAGIALFGFIVYVGAYTFAKRKGEWGVFVGSVSGAVPIVVGYTAVINHLDVTAGILFLIMVVWQMPHFYAIAMFRLQDYVAAGIPILPATKGFRTTKFHIVGYLLLYLLSLPLLALYGHAGYVYLLLTLHLGVLWLLIALRGFWTKDDTAWAKKLFLFSLVVLVVFSFSIAIAPLVV